MASNQPNIADIDCQPSPIEQGGAVRLRATDRGGKSVLRAVWDLPGNVQIRRRPGGRPEARATWRVPKDLRPGVYDVQVRLELSGGGQAVGTERVQVQARPFASGDAVVVDGPVPLRIAGPVPVSLSRSQVEPTDDQAFWVAIRNQSSRLGFEEYREFMDLVLCGKAPSKSARRIYDQIDGFRSQPFPDSDAYRVLKTATEVFLMVNCGVRTSIGPDGAPFAGIDPTAEAIRLGASGAGDPTAAVVERWKRYVNDVPTGRGGTVPTLPYLEVIRLRLGEVDVVRDRQLGTACYGILRSKLTQPCMIELIWEYWHRAGHLADVVSALMRRFQNVRSGDSRDPLANLDLDPLRPMSTMFWGLVNDQMHWLSDARLDYELLHHYGITLAADPMQPADSRVHFLQAFHNLLSTASAFYERDDDTTVIADAFPVLNSLREVHLQLTEGQGNQYGGLPWQGRIENLIRQYLLARPEIRDFLPGRTMVAYPEGWMQPVESVNRLHGLNGPSIMHFRDLGVFGEQLLLGIRYGNWNGAVLPQQAANWARYFRTEIQGYVHAYRAVTGADLTADPVDATPPSLHLARRMQEQLATAGVHLPTAAHPRARAVSGRPGYLALTPGGAEPARIARDH